MMKHLRNGRPLGSTGQTASNRDAVMDWRQSNIRLRRREAEAIAILREAVCESRNPVMLYSIGKDSSAMLHIALKAFAPGKPPFPLLHIDTTWKCREMIAFRDETVARAGLDLLVHINEEGLRRRISPIASGSVLHTQVMKTDGLRQAFDRWKFDLAFGGARRDEEKSRAKERIFSHRTATHAWDPQISGQNCGNCSTRASKEVNRCASFRSPIGPS